MFRLRLLRPALVRITIGILAVVLALVLYLGLNPGTLRALLLFLPFPGVVTVPTPGPTPPSPRFADTQGEIPGGFLAFAGAFQDGTFACGFLMELEDGQKVGVSAAHATPVLSGDVPAQLCTPGREPAALLRGQLARGSTFQRANFSSDYVLWDVSRVSAGTHLVQPDPRGRGEPGERVFVYSWESSRAGTPIRHPGVILSATEEAIWIQLEESFSPAGYSGCPVLSQHTGKLIGMAVAGEDKHPVVMGLHPAGSLIEKAQAVLSSKGEP